jgi:hypothetical protein
MRSRKWYLAVVAALGLVAGALTGGHVQGRTGDSGPHIVGVYSASAADLNAPGSKPLIWAPRQVAAPGDAVLVVAEAPPSSTGVDLVVEMESGSTRIPLSFDGKALWEGRLVAEPGLLRYRVEGSPEQSGASEWIDVSVVEPTDIDIQLGQIGSTRSWTASIGPEGSGADFEVVDVSEGARQLPPSFAVASGSPVVIDLTAGQMAFLGASGVERRVELPGGAVPLDIVSAGSGFVLSDPLNRRTIELSGATGHLTATRSTTVFDGGMVPFNTQLVQTTGSSTFVRAPVASGVIDVGQEDLQMFSRTGPEDETIVVNVHDGLLHLGIGGAYYRIGMPGGTVDVAKDLIAGGQGLYWLVIGVGETGSSPAMLLLRVDTHQQLAEATDIGFLDGDVTRRLAAAPSGVVALTEPRSNQLVWTEYR